MINSILEFFHLLAEEIQDISKQIRNYFKNALKPLLVILIYFLYQGNFLISLLNSVGLSLSNVSKTLKIIILILNDLAYILVLLLLFKKDILNGLKDLKKNFKKRSILSINCWMIGCLVMTTSSFMIGLILNKSVSGNEAVVRESIKLAPVYMFFACSIVAPIFEEMVFRKALYELIKPNWLFILISGFGFGVLHVLGTYTTPLEFLYVIPYGAMGTAFAYLLTKTKNIALPIIIHMLHNTILVLVQIIGG